MNGAFKGPYLGRRWFCFRKKEIILLLKATLRSGAF